MSESNQQLGELYPSDTLFLRNDVGSANSSTGDAYELASNFGDHSPIVRSRQSGKWFRLSWQEIITLAVAKGIDK